MVTNPNISTTENLAKSKGWTLEYTREMSNHVTQMAAGEGLHFDFDKAVVANSFNAHRLLQYAKTIGKGDALKESLLYAYFSDGKNTDDDETLFALAAKVGLPEDEARNVIENKTLFAEKVHADVLEAQRFGIQGVPFFVVDRKYGISGAQEVPAFSQTLEKAFAEWKSAQPEIKLETIDGAVCTPDGNCD
jgi:predicted DsbA family dithiol-disulfide isomerase